MRIEIPEAQLAMIVHRSNIRDSGYNGAWLDGHRTLATELGIVAYNKKTGRYEEVKR